MSNLMVIHYSHNKYIEFFKHLTLGITNNSATKSPQQVY
jgi:hypothetical protein